MNLSEKLSAINSRGGPESGLLLRVTGTDAMAFLQGQCTQDLRTVPVGGATRTLWLSLKGKVMAETLALHVAENDWWLWSPHGDGASLKQRLEDFIIADDVTVADLHASQGWKRHTLTGASATRWLAMNLDGNPPPAVDTWKRFAGGILICGRRNQPGIWDWLRPDNPSAPSLTPPPEACPSEDALKLGRVRAGIPAIPDEFGPNDLPQEAGLEAVAISFNKGCYLGQEVMARLHAMGRVRRALRTVEGDGVPPATPATLWTTAIDAQATTPAAGGRKLGELRAALADPDRPGGWIGLALVQLQESPPPAMLEDGRVVTVLRG